jgi:hypothetical protein
MSTSTRPAVDIAPTGNRGLITLILGFLSVPGSTLAWDLPAGGFWIGVPLCIAALVIGTRARRENEEPGKALVGMVLAGLMLAMTVVWTVVSLVG